MPLALEDARDSDPTMALFGYEVEPDRYLYHYTGKEVALRHILPSRTIKVGLLQHTNDPRESQQWLVSLSGGSEGRPTNEEFFEIVRGADELIKATTKVACFTRDDPGGMSRPGEEQFARGWAHSRMWAQYAAGHSGVCLILEQEAVRTSMSVLGSIGTLWDGPVHYANSPHTDVDASTIHYEDIVRRGLNSVVEDHVQRHYRGLFFVKNMDWASEWEYRWVLHGGERVPEFIDISDALAGIVVGPSFPPSGVAELKTHIAGFRLDDDLVTRCHWRNGFPMCLPHSEAALPTV